MHSDFSLEKDALSCGNDHFQFQTNQKKLNIKTPRTPPWTLFFEKKYFFPRQFKPFLKLLINKINGTSTPSVRKKAFSWCTVVENSKNRKLKTSDFNEIRYIGLFYPKNKLVKVKRLYFQNFSKYEPHFLGYHNSKSFGYRDFLL